MLNNNEYHFEELEEEFFDLYDLTKNSRVKNRIIECYFKMIKATSSKTLTKKLIKSLHKILDKVENKDYFYYLNLSKLYCEEIKLNRLNKEKLFYYINKIIVLINKGYFNNDIVGVIIDHLIPSLIENIVLRNKVQIKETVKQIKELVELSKYKDRRPETIKKRLIIELIELIIKFEFDNLLVDEVEELKERVDELDRIAYEKELEISCDYYLNALDLLKEYINKEYDKMTLSLKTMTRRVNLMDIDVYEIYLLAYFTDKTKHIISDTNKELSNKILRILGKNEYKQDPFIKKSKEWLIK